MTADFCRLGVAFDFVWIGDFVLCETCALEGRKESSFISMIPRMYILGFFIKFTLKRMFLHGCRDQFFESVVGYICFYIIRRSCRVEGI